MSDTVTPEPATDAEVLREMAADLATLRSRETHWARPGWSIPPEAQSAGAYRQAMRTRWMMAALLLAIIAAGTTTSAIVALMNRHDVSSAVEAVGKSGTYSTYEDCMADVETTPTQCENDFPE